MKEKVYNSKYIFCIYKIYCNFAVTVVATLQSEKTAYQGGSFAFYTYVFENIIPPMPLFDAHLGGFSFLNILDYDLR